jgi:IclR-like helix-turn-helix domain-containing protein
VNNHSQVKIEGSFDALTGRLLNRLPDVEAIQREAKRPSGQATDAVVRFAGSKTPVTIEAKKRLNAAAARQVIALAEERDLPVIAIAEETTADARRILADHGIGVVDGLGNTDLRLPGLWMHLEGHPERDRFGAPSDTAPKTRLSGKTGVAAQALLLEPERGWKVHALATRADISRGLAHRMLVRLEDEGLVRAEGSGPRKVRVLTDRGGLLDLLVEETAVRPLKTPAFRLAQSPKALIRDVAKALEGKGVDYALTGAGAASLVAPFISAVPIVEVWVSAYLMADRVLDEFGMEKVETGQNIELLQANDDGPLMFRQPTKGVWVANPFRLYIDLLHDPRRGREQAEVLREEVIGF